MQEEARLVESIIEEMGPLFCKGSFGERKTFCFTLGETSMTVAVDADSYAVTRGAAPADCSCRTGAEMFKKIWYDGYRPGLVDFLSGQIKCDAPLLLPQFLKAFGK